MAPSVLLMPTMPTTPTTRSTSAIRTPTGTPALATPPRASAPGGPTSGPTPGPTHACVRCGAPVPLDVAMCERCNPLGLSQPASSQAHGTVFVGIALAVVGLAVVGRLALQGVGPFSASVASVSVADGGLSVTLRVRNEGTRAGATTCRITDAVVPGTRAGFVATPNLEPGETVTVTARVTELGTEPRLLAAECSTP